MVVATNLKSFLYLGDCFLWYPEVMGALEPLVPFISGPARKVELSYHYLQRLTLALSVSLFLLVIFQLTRTKFQTFAYNSRTVCFSYIIF